MWVTQMTYTCDQEGAVRTCMHEALEVAKGRGEYVGAVPENSAVGEAPATVALKEQSNNLKINCGPLLVNLSIVWGNA